jgi:hypothetical protein
MEGKYVGKYKYLSFNYILIEAEMAKNRIEELK